MIKSFSVLSLSLLFILSSCGGGGSAKTTTVTPPTFEPPGEVIQIESEVSLGQSTELVLYAPDSDISNILWRQTAGADLEFYAKDSKVIGFTPAESGSYGLEVDYTIDGSTTNTISHTFTVDDNQSQLSVRLGHAVVEGNAVSLVSYATNDSESNEIDKSSWRWTQTKGPSVVFSELSTNGQVAVFFDAPNVDEDTVLKFALAGEIEGEGHTDEIAILVENSTISVPLDDAPFTNRVANVFLYNPNSPAGEQLINCVYSNNTKYDDCNFGQSPLIAQVTTSPTVDDIMNRVIVSHQWMGDQFKKFLENYDTNDDFKNLLRATTAVVISYDIRPSFYSPTLGAIYLDPDDLWENIGLDFCLQRGFSHIDVIILRGAFLPNVPIKS